MNLRNASDNEERKLTPLEVAAHNLTQLHRAIVAKQKAVEDMRTAMSRADCELANLVNEYAKQQAAFQLASTGEFSEHTKSLLSRETHTHPAGKANI